MNLGRRHGVPEDAARGKALAVGVGVALSVLSLGLLVWMAVDVDGDGRSSYAEFQSGTSPVNGDTDGDGVADGWELDHGYDALSSASAPEIAASPDPAAPVDEDAASDLTDCRIADITVEGCAEDDESSVADEGTGSEPAPAEAPPTGKSGVGGTSAIGVVTTVIAGVAGRVIAVRVLHS